MGNIFGMCRDPSDARHHPLCPQGAIQALLASFILFWRVPKLAFPLLVRFQLEVCLGFWCRDAA